MKVDIAPSRVLGLAAGGIALAVLLAVWSLFVAAGFYVGQVVLVGTVLGLLMLMLPLGTLLIILLLVTFVFQGLGAYFLRFTQAHWLPYLLCLLLAVRAFDLRQPSRPGLIGAPGPAWSTAPVVCLLVYFAALAASTLIFRPPLAQIVVALKNALPIWIVTALMLQARRIPGIVDRLWLVMRVVFFLQLPFALLQHFVIAPRRHDALSATSADAVTGTFGGLIEAGGANSTMVLFVLLVMAYQLALWLRRRCSTSMLLVYWGVGLVIILAGEVKAALIWLPLVIFWVARRRVLASFGSALAALGVGIVLVVSVYGAYKTLYWRDAPAAQGRGVLERMEYFFDPANINYRTGEISRGASIALWLKDSRADVATRLVGYGPGASRISATGGLGEVAKRYRPLSLAATSMALLLWDSGIVGAAAYLGVILFTWVMLARQSNDKRLDARQQAAADAFGAAALMMLSLYVYNRGLNDEPSTQLMLALAVGLGLHWRAIAPGRNRGTAARQPCRA